jgi:hypothetical protein
MSTRETKCSFWQLPYTQAGAYEKYLRNRHAKLYENLFNQTTRNASESYYDPLILNSKREASRLPSPLLNPYEQPIEELPDITYPVWMNQSDYELDLSDYE